MRLARLNVQGKGEGLCERNNALEEGVWTDEGRRVKGKNDVSWMTDCKADKEINSSELNS